MLADLSGDREGGTLLGGRFSGAALRDIREQLGISQSGLATAVGVSQPTVSGWENGVKVPSTRRLPLLAGALRCRIDLLYTEGATTGAVSCTCGRPTVAAATPDQPAVPPYASDTQSTAPQHQLG